MSDELNFTQNRFSNDTLPSKYLEQYWPQSCTEEWRDECQMPDPRIFFFLLLFICIYANPCQKIVQS